MNIFKLFRNKTFLSWMISYIIILILPIIIGSFAYYQSVTVIKEETESIHSANLNQLKILIDGKLSELNRVSSEISINDQIKSFMSLQPPLLPADEYTKKELQNTLVRYVTANSFIDDIYIYFKKGDFYLSTSSLYREDTFHDMSSSKFGLSYDELSQFIRNTRYISYRIVQNSASQNGISGKIIIAHTVVTTDMLVSDAMILITVDQNKLMQVMKNVALASKETVILSDNQNNYLSSGKTDNLPSFSQYTDSNKTTSILYTRYSGEDSTIMRLPSSIKGWQYISVMPSKTYLQKVVYIKNIIIIYVSFCLITGLVVSYYITRRNYIPLKNLTQMFANDSGQVSGKGQNEFSFLEKGVKELLVEKATARKRLDQQAQALRNFFMIRLLKGRTETKSISKEALEQYKIAFTGNDFLVILFQIEDINLQYPEQATADGEESVELAYFIVKNIIEELVNEKYTGYTAEIDGMPVCLVNLDTTSGTGSTAESILNDMEQIASKAKEFISTNFNIIISVAISNIHSSASGIAKAYLECVEIFDYKTLIGNSNIVIQYHSIDVNEKRDFESNHTLYKDRQLINCIIDGDYKTAGLIFNEIFTSEFIEKKYSLQRMKFRMFGLANLILAALDEAKNPKETDFINKLGLINRIVNAKSVTELQKQAGYIFEKINEFYANTNREFVSERVDEIEEYIRNHFQEQDISVLSICTKFQITSSYFSRIFKKHTDMNLPEYLHKLRIEKAKQLLENTDLNINDIAEKVGFYNALTLGRVFKKVEGITPGQFRERNSNAEKP